MKGSEVGRVDPPERRRRRKEEHEDEEEEEEDHGPHRNANVKLHLDDLIHRLKNGEKFRQVEMRVEEIEQMLDKVKKVLMDRPMLLELRAPVNILGDIHGQYTDLRTVFNKITGWPSNKSPILCLGDYVDRGKFGIEVVVLLFALKVKYPDSVHVLRGNHETSSVSRVYGFFDECKQRFDLDLWHRFMETFDCLPVGALINDAILCMHGGLSPHLKCLQDIRRLPRPTDVPAGGLLTDLLWSDPTHNTNGWSENSRGVSFEFGKDVVLDLCHKFNIDVILRGHQVVYQGIEMFADSHMVTIFTAPNFCGQYENMGGVLKLDRNLKLSMFFLDGTKNGYARKPEPKQGFYKEKWISGKQSTAGISKKKNSNKGSPKKTTDKSCTVKTKSKENKVKDKSNAKASPTKKPNAATAEKKPKEEPKRP